MARKRKRSKGKKIEQPIGAEQTGIDESQSPKEVQPAKAIQIDAKKTKTSQLPPKVVPKKGPSTTHKMGSFFKDVKAELKKVSWPDQEKTTQSTLVVIFTLLMLSGCMTLFTVGFTKVFAYFFSTD